MKMLALIVTLALVSARLCAEDNETPDLAIPLPFLAETARDSRYIANLQRRIAELRAENANLKKELAGPKEEPTPKTPKAAPTPRLKWSQVS